jgi:hypothetical protein
VRIRRAIVFINHRGEKCGVGYWCYLLFFF